MKFARLIIAGLIALILIVLAINLMSCSAGAQSDKPKSSHLEVLVDEYIGSDYENGFIKLLVFRVADSNDTMIIRMLLLSPHSDRQQILEYEIIYDSRIQKRRNVDPEKFNRIDSLKKRLQQIEYQLNKEERGLRK